MAASTSESSAEVASSRIRIGAVLEHDASDRDTLALATGEFHAAFAHMGVVALAPLSGR